MSRRVTIICALLACLGLAACQNPDGSTDYLRSAAGGALAGAGAGVLGGVVNDISNSQRGGPRYGYPMPRGADGPAWSRRF